MKPDKLEFNKIKMLEKNINVKISIFISKIKKLKKMKNILLNTTIIILLFGCNNNAVNNLVEFSYSLSTNS